MLLSVCPEVDRNLLMKLSFLRFDLIGLTLFDVTVVFRFKNVRFKEDFQFKQDFTLPKMKE